MKLLIFVSCLLGATLAQDPIFGIFTFKCPTALNCINRPLCDYNGYISTNTVELTEEQELFRVPLLPCRMDQTARGVCCRDPNYVDDWPTNTIVNENELSQPVKPPSGGSGCPSRNRVSENLDC